MAENQNAGTPAKAGSPEEIDKDLKEIILFLSGFVKALIDRLKDGFQPLPDVIALIPSLLPGQQAYEENENAWKYLSSLSDEKTNETVALIMKELEPVAATKREIIKRVLLLLAGGYMLYLAFKADAEANPSTPSETGTK